MQTVKFIERQLSKYGLKNGSINAAMTKQLRVVRNGNSELGYIAIDDLKDPSRAEYDHFTTIYPQTVKYAIELMLGRN